MRESKVAEAKVEKRRERGELAGGRLAQGTQGTKSR